MRAHGLIGNRQNGKLQTTPGAATLYANWGASINNG
jgi:hypothetical protein